ncbi:MAG: FRG domain-containing protein [Verrucomicrobiae bacterium]|nr:FRG domain-containing protein [Verrucomicrobiae bacterium]NNJ42141.1 FRG domain-containing protein [Akkermansiaceae bacterium]
MRTLHSDKVWSYFDAHPEGKKKECQLRKENGLVVTSYHDLACKIAALQFNNPNFVLLFRGQSSDRRHHHSRNTTIRPNIFRGDQGLDVDEWNKMLENRYKTLHLAEDLLIQKWPELEKGKFRIQRSAVIRWAILQHYEVCRTPLLDLTHSLRIAASFASLANASGETPEDLADESMAEDAFLMVHAIPQIGGGVSTCAYDEMQTLRLASICPPSAMRAHLQEGYLIGEYPELQTFRQKMNLDLDETDFGKRLIAKFKFKPSEFWDSEDTFARIPKPALYPNDDDSLYRTCCEIKSQLPETP